MLSRTSQVCSKCEAQHQLVAVSGFHSTKEDNLQAHIQQGEAPGGQEGPDPWCAEVSQHLVPHNMGQGPRCRQEHPPGLPQPHRHGRCAPGLHEGITAAHSCTGAFHCTCTGALLGMEVT